MIASIAKHPPVPGAAQHVVAVPVLSIAAVVWAAVRSTRKSLWLAGVLQRGDSPGWPVVTFHPGDHALPQFIVEVRGSVTERVERRETADGTPYGKGGEAWRPVQGLVGGVAGALSALRRRRAVQFVLAGRLAVLTWGFIATAAQAMP